MKIIGVGVFVFALSVSSGCDELLCSASDGYVELANLEFRGRIFLTQPVDVRAKYFKSCSDGISSESLDTTFVFADSTEITQDISKDDEFSGDYFAKWQEGYDSGKTYHATVNCDTDAIQNQDSINCRLLVVDESEFVSNGFSLHR